MFKFKNFLIYILFSLFLFSCAYNNAHVKNPRDQAKLEYQLLVEAYFSVYKAVSDFLTNPYVDKDAKNYVMRKITPKLNALKREIIKYGALLDDTAIDDWELLNQIRMLESQLVELRNQVRGLSNGKQN